MADIYIRHDCDVVIDVNGCAKVFVTVYDRANVKVRQGGMGRVYVYKNGDSWHRVGRCLFGNMEA